LARDQANAEDLASETLVQAWRSIGRFDGSCRFSTWLFSILLHRYQKHVRAAASRPVSASSLPLDDNCTKAPKPDESPSPAEQLDARERAAAILRALNLLPEKQRQVLLLRFFQDCSLEEIATVAGCSTGTVKSRLHYGLEALRAAQDELNLQELRGDT
jgi:RNA polymerase sigma-70 factor (ECF subfamily)